MTIHSFVVSLVAGMLLIFTPAALAEEPTPNPAANADHISRWVEQLDAEKFSDREEAGQNLAEEGEKAIDAVAKAAQGGSREASGRALDILKQWMESSDESLKAKTKDVLEKIASGEGRAARRAREILDPNQNQPQPGEIGGPQMIPQPIQGRIQIVPGGRIQIGGGIIQGRAIRIQNANGEKDIEVQEGGRKVRIKEDAKGTIKMKVVEEVRDANGKVTEKSSEYEAKDADDLKKNHPEAHKLYEKYGKQQPIVQQFQFVPAQGIPAQAIPLLPVIPQDESKKKAREEVENAKKQLEEAIESLKSLREKEGEAQNLRDIQEKIDGARAKLDRAIEQLGE